MPGHRLGSALCAVVVSLACATSEPHDSSASTGSGDRAALRHGRDLYHRHCGSCHGTTARGDGPLAMILEPAPPDLTRIAARRGGAFPEAGLLRLIDGRDPVVAHGTREMPVWGDRFAEGTSPSLDREVARRGKALVILEYLQTLQRP